LKTNQFQMYENKLTPEQMRNDTDIINFVCDLYDQGATVKVISQIFNDIHKERARDLADDISNYESHLHDSIGR
jgi:Zn-dependent M32 family carboxypeptidase